MVVGLVCEDEKRRVVVIEIKRESGDYSLLAFPLSLDQFKKKNSKQNHFNLAAYPQPYPIFFFFFGEPSGCVF